MLRASMHRQFHAGTYEDMHKEGNTSLQQVKWTHFDRTYIWKLTSTKTAEPIAGMALEQNTLNTSPVVQDITLIRRRMERSDL